MLQKIVRIVGILRRKGYTLLAYDEHGTTFCNGKFAVTVTVFGEVFSWKENGKF